MKKKILFLNISLISLGILFVALGIYFGDTESIFRKAIFICMECIGLG